MSLDLAHELSDLANRALFFELNLAPKPGLVTPNSNGSHDDMDYALFVKSGDALVPYWHRLVCLVLEHPSEFYGVLSQNLRLGLIRLGVAAEAEMMRATNGINTHRGLIFSLGLAVLGVATQIVQGRQNAVNFLVGCQQRIAVLAQQIVAAQGKTVSATELDLLRSATVEATSGLASVFEIALPVYRHAKKLGFADVACWQAVLLHLMAQIDDTTWHRRAGDRATVFGLQKQLRQDLESVRNQAEHEAVLAKWCEIFVVNRYTCGGAADLLAVAFFVVEAQAWLEVRTSPSR